MNRGALAAVTLAIAACGNAASNPQPAPTAPPVATPPSTATLLASMATLTGVVAEPAHLETWARKIDGGAPLGTFIDELLASERFAGEVIPALVFGQFVNVRNYYALPAAFILARSADDSSAPFYLRSPCTAAEAIAVRPWWDLRSEVKVCPDAYRPTKWTLAANEHSYKTPTVLACDSQVGSPESETHSLCGCGPNLIRCLRDQDQYNQFSASFQDEVKRTTAYVVQHDLSMASLFAGNATFRDRNAELYYRRQKIGALELERVEAELAGLDAWPQDGQWAPREEVRPGQHAGVLTAPQILHWLPDRRQRQRAYYEMLWCNLKNSFGATTHKVLELNTTGNNFFAADSWKQLAHTELCTNCHARLDYGFQFFMGYPDSRASTHYTPALHSTATGPLYGQDIKDHRGDGPLTPQGFANLATAQPDFKSCMTNHFVSYVLGDRATADDVRAIETAVDTSGTFKAPMKVALERYSARWRADYGAASPTPPARLAASQRGPNGGMVIGPALRAKLDQQCGDCHDEAPYTDTTDRADLPVDFRGAELPRSLMVSMADQVAFGMMPKSEALDPRAREELVQLLIDTLWSDAPARLEAERYYLGRSRGLPAHQLDNALFGIGHRTQTRSEIRWGALERGIWSDQSTITPGFLAITGLEALRACARSNGDKLDACLLRSTSLDLLSRWPSTPGAAP